MATLLDLEPRGRVRQGKSTRSKKSGTLQLGAWRFYPSARATAWPAKARGERRLGDKKCSFSREFLIEQRKLSTAFPAIKVRNTAVFMKRPQQSTSMIGKTGTRWSRLRMLNPSRVGRPQRQYEGNSPLRRCSHEH